MKTLDEVIAYFDNQTQQRHVYLTEDAEDIYNDALHHLKTIETTENLYHDAVNELSKWKDEDWKDRCLPLTWDELKQMKGEPVWVKHKHYNKWLIVYEVYENTIVLDGNGCYTQYFSDDNDKEVRWQAYRKENNGR